MLVDFASLLCIYFFKLHLFTYSVYEILYGMLFL